MAFPVRRPDPGYEVTDVGEAMWELYVRSRYLSRILEHYAVDSDPWFPRPADEFVFVTNAVKDIQKWTDRVGALLTSEKVA